MPDDVVIRVENLSKRYRLGELHKQTNSFREKVTQALRRKVQSAKRKANNPIPKSTMPSAQHAMPHALCSMPREPDTIWALRNVSFEVKRGEIVGIIGRNGAGKSTLLKVLSRITKPTEGRAWINGRVGSLLEVGTGFHAELTGRENIYLNGAILGMTKAEIRRKFDEIVDFAEVKKFIDTPVKRYSSGMYVRLAFAVAAHLEPEILLVDEVLAVGDAAFQKKCLGKMGEVSKGGRTVLFVSHNMGSIQHLCNQAMLFDTGVLSHSGTTFETIKIYERTLLMGNDQMRTAPNIIYDIENKTNENKSDFDILRIEILDRDDHPKDMVYTWDTVKFRITFLSRRNIKFASAVLQISSTYDTPLFLCSTQPDSKVSMNINKGQNIVECEFSSLPFSAGEYIVGVGLAIPNKEWLYRNQQIGKLIVHPKDVYQSGVSPTVTRSILAIPHKWRIL
jgi:lipopolysaccharide transport system ATP-binding protein